MVRCAGFDRTLYFFEICLGTIWLAADLCRLLFFHILILIYTHFHIFVLPSVSRTSKSVPNMYWMWKAALHVLYSRAWFFLDQRQWPKATIFRNRVLLIGLPTISPHCEDIQPQLGLWQNAVGGRWTLVEMIPSGAFRFYRPDIL